MYSQNIGMEFSKEKYPMLVMKSGKRHLTDRIELLNQDEIRRLCHVVSHWEDRNKITTILVFELTVASCQRMTVKKECGSQ